MSHTVALELLDSERAGESLDIIFGNFDLKFLGSLVLDDFPFDTGYCALEFTCDILSLKLAVGAGHEFLEEFEGELHACAVCLHQIVLGHTGEELTAVGSKSLRDHLADTLTIFFFVVNGVGTEYFVVEFLTELGGFVDDILADNDLEVTAGFLYFIAVDVKHGSDFSFVAVASGESVEHYSVACLCAFELIGLLF